MYPSMFKKKRKISGKGRVLTIDTEMIGLLPSLHADLKCGHCIVCKDFHTKEYFVFFDPYKERNKKTRVKLKEWEGEQDGYLHDGIIFMNEAKVIISQNWIGFDIHAINTIAPDVCSVDFTKKTKGKLGKKFPFRVMDTLVMSQLLNPDRRAPFKAIALGKGNVAPHSIEAQGIKMGRYKPDNEDWSCLTDHMIHRCWEDVSIGEQMYKDLWDEWQETIYYNKKAKEESHLSFTDAYAIEAEFTNFTTEVEKLGFCFDMKLAHKHCKVLDKYIAKIEKDAIPKLPLVIAKKKLDITAMKKACEKAGHVYSLDVTHGSTRSTNWGFVTQTGNYSANTKKDFPDSVGAMRDHPDPVVVGAYTPVVWEKIALGGRVAVKKALYDLGWRGVNLTEGEERSLEEEGVLPYPYVGKLDSDSMEAWTNAPPWAIEILKYFIYSHRRSQILNKKDMEYYAENGEWANHLGQKKCRGLVPRAVDVASGKEFQELIEIYGDKFWHKKRWDKDAEFRVPAVIFAIGTNTFRCRHKNVVNIPSRGLFGKEMRQLFVAKKGYYLVGCDASGIELRMLAEYMGDKDYIKVLLEGDIHSHHQHKAGLESRDHSKKFIYSWIYGSGVPNLALSLGISTKKMKKIIDNFLRSFPKLDELINAVKKSAVDVGYLVAPDARWGRVRKSNRKVKEHTALNVLLQMVGSLVVKYATIITRDQMRAEGLDTRFVAHVHDEFGFEVPKSEVSFIEYKVKKSDWEREEKEEKKVKGKIYSAPVVIEETKKSLLVIRSYHRAGQIAKTSFAKAGKVLGLKIPLDGEYKIGESWSETH